ncbi:hypothetical protein B0H66DRAFT_563859 [Apodospora peruviana]|uniref:DUF7580 domain-containing protein n=1 Tax=Apodospora peruviana TaxID=516989 RepID=A0AAE0HXR5_9PEZI|nr:hypothetical protein B0H66DRAFT_563859 [Apodospora peruviana]
MSGFEVAGVVLGSLPILVGALELYMKGAGTMQKWRFYKRELKSLIRTIETEEVKLKNVYEKLLWGIAPAVQIEKMIDDPFGNLWKEKEIYGRVRLRLSNSFHIFEKRVLDMRDAVDEIKEKLGIQTEGTTQWTENASVRRELKRASFILQRANYQELLTRIRDGVSDLEGLITSGLDMEPSRRRLSQVRLCKLIRTVSGSIYHALRSAVACTCPNLHEVGLRLMPRSATAISKDEDEDIIKSLSFQIAFSYESTTLESECNSSGRLKRWGELLVRPAVHGEPPSAPVTPPSPPPPRQQRSVRFSVPTNTNGPPSGSVLNHQATTATLIMGTCWIPMTERIGDIQDICQLMRKSSKQRTGECCGHITDASSHERRKYGVYPHSSLADGGDWSVVSLRQVLTNSPGTAGPSLLYGDKLRLAWTIASSVLQLHGTPWISTTPTLGDIYLVQRNGQPYYQDAFVLKHLPEAPPPPTQIPATTTTPTAKNITPLALGVLLVELILGQTMASFRPSPQGPDINLPTAANSRSDLLADYDTAMKYLDRVNMIGGANYENAVRRCIRGGYYYQPNSDVDDEVLQTDVFVGVVSLLEEDLKNSTA